MQNKYYNGVYRHEKINNGENRLEIIKSIDTFDINIFNKTMNDYKKINLLELIDILHKLKSKKSKLNYDYSTSTSLFKFIIYSLFVCFVFIFMIYLIIYTNELNRKNVKNILRNTSSRKIDVVLTPKLLLINLCSLTILTGMLICEIYLIKKINTKYPIKYFIRNKINHIDKMILTVESKITNYL